MMRLFVACLLCMTWGLQAEDPSSMNYAQSIVESAAETTTGTTYTIGQYAQGGVIFWLDRSSQHGLVAAIEDQSTGVEWGSDGTFIGAAASGVVFGADYTTPGQINTNVIVAVLGTGSNYAAPVCTQYTAGGYSDWYLPCIDELAMMSAQRSIINKG